MEFPMSPNAVLAMLFLALWRDQRDGILLTQAPQGPPPEPVLSYSDVTPSASCCLIQNPGRIWALSFMLQALCSQRQRPCAQRARQKFPSPSECPVRRISGFLRAPAGSSGLLRAPPGSLRWFVPFLVSPSQISEDFHVQLVDLCDFHVLLKISEFTLFLQWKWNVISDFRNY